ncbi:MAG: dodecin family protein [Candidatus Omnitrophica bacterium]|nr:dodecin family protein [Candidatus Omnitrophota bacterium]
MLELLEVVGVSEDGFSQATQAAIEQILSRSRRIHFFEVVEQRGAVRDGKLKEFQVKLKVAVDMEQVSSPAPDAPAASRDECPSCRQTAPEHGHLCVPRQAGDHQCEWCGALIPDERHLCTEKIKELAYVCNSCGRTAVRAEYLCEPRKID